MSACPQLLGTGDGVQDYDAEWIQSWPPSVNAGGLGAPRTVTEWLHWGGEDPPEQVDLVQ